MRDSLSYQGYVGSVHFNADDEVFYGKIVGVDDLVTFEGTTVADLASVVPGSGRGLRGALPERRETGTQVVQGQLQRPYSGFTAPAGAAEQATVRISLNRLVQGVAAGG